MPGCGCSMVRPRKTKMIKKQSLNAWMKKVLKKKKQNKYK